MPAADYLWEEEMKKETILNKDFILLLSVNAFVFIGMHMLSTTIAKYAMTLQGTAAVAGLIAGAFSITSIIVRPICGTLIDRKKKKSLYLFSLVTILISMIGYSLSSTNGMLLAFRLVHGVGWGFATTIGMTMAANTAPEGKIGEASSVYGLANVLAMALAPNLGTFLNENYGYRVMFLGAGVIMACAVVCLILVADQPVPEGSGMRKFTAGSMVQKEAVVPAVVLFLSGMVYTSITTFLILYATETGISNPSTFFTVYSVAILIVRLNSGKIVDRKGPEYILIPAGFFFCGCLLVLANLKNAPMLYLSAALMGFGYSGNLSTLMALSFKRAPKDKRGAVSSTINVGMDVGTGIGSTVAGILAGWMGYQKLYLVLCIPVILSTLLFAFDQKAFRQKTWIYKE